MTTALIPSWRASARPGLTLAAAKAQAAPGSDTNPSIQQSTNPAPLGAIIRPSARDRWLSGILSYYTPTICETTARSAMAGNLFAQWLMFDLIEQTSPRISKNLNELKNGVKALDRQVQPWTLKGSKPTAEAVKRAAVIEAGLKSMRPRLAYNEADLDGTLYDALDAVGKGIAVLEADYEQRDMGALGNIWAPRATHWVHPRYYGYPPGTSTQDRLMLNSREVGFVNPEFLTAAGNGADVQLWIDFPEERFIVSIIKQKSGHPLNASMLRILGFWWAATNFTWEWFLKFAQIFGAPFTWATYEQGASQDTIDQILNMLDQLGGFGRAAFPQGTVIDFKEAITQGTNNPQLLLLDAANTVFDLVILGQTLTSQTGDQGKGGGSYALGQVHAGVRGEKIMATAAEAQRVLNHSLIPSLCRLNFGDDSQCPTLVLCERKTSDPLAMAQRDQVLTSIAGVKMLKSEFYDRHELSVPGPGDEVIEAPAAAPGAPPSGGSVSPSPGGEGRGEGGPSSEPATAAAKAGLSAIASATVGEATPEEDAKAQIAGALQTHLRPVLERLLLARIKAGLVDGLAEPRQAVASAAGTSEGARKAWETRRGMAGAEKAADRRELDQSRPELEGLKAHDPGAMAADKAADEREGNQANAASNDAMAAGHRATTDDTGSAHVEAALAYRHAQDLQQQAADRAELAGDKVAARHHRRMAKFHGATAEVHDKLAPYSAARERDRAEKTANVRERTQQ